MIRFFRGHRSCSAELDRRQLGARTLPSNVYGVLHQAGVCHDARIGASAASRDPGRCGRSRERRNLIRCSSPKRNPSPVVRETGLFYLPLRALSARAARDTLAVGVQGRRPVSDDVSGCTGHPFVPHEVAERISSAASVPVYGFLDQYLGRWIVGGSSIASRRMATRRPGLFCGSWKGESPPSSFPRSVKQQGHVSTGARCSGGGISEQRLLPEAKSSSGNRHHGRGTRGKSHSSPPLFWSRPG